MVDAAEVEKRTDLVKTAAIEIASPVGGIISATVADLIRVAELYARSGVMVPPHCRDKPGVCFALCKQALDWGVPDLAVINKSYVVNNRGTERIAYESQLIHAVIERNAPLKGRLRYEITGEGDERRCKVWGTFKGEDKPHEYLSETLGKLRDARGRNEQGQLKGSPLWDALPEVQLFYSASRQWARLFCPDVILGVYTPEDAQFEPLRDVTPVADFAARLEEAKKARASAQPFDATKVNSIIEGDTNPGVASKEAEDDGDSGRPQPDHAGRASVDMDRATGGRDQDASPQAGAGDQGDGGAPVGKEAARQTQGGGEAGRAAGEARPKPKAKRR